MKEKTIKLELENKNPYFDSCYYESLPLPATTNEIRDVLHRIRVTDRQLLPSQISIYDCELIPVLTDCRMDSPTLDELNFLANRLAQLSENEITVMHAVVSDFVKGDEDDLVSVRDLINMTYGLSSVSVISNVSNDEELGEFVIDNELHSTVEAVPEEFRHLLDKEKLGRVQRAADDGVYIGNTYVLAGEFELPKVYDGITLPESAPEQWYAFRLLVSEAPRGDEATDNSAEWISLPMTDSDMAAAAHRHHAKSLAECVYYDFDSSIPQITSEDFTTMRDIEKLNEMALRMAEMSPGEQVTFKAALEAEKMRGTTFEHMYDACMNLHGYEINTHCTNASEFFKEYLLTYMDSKFDEKWISDIYCGNEGQKLLSKLGASVTEYGVVSACSGSLYQLVPFDEQSESPDEEIEDDKEMNMTM